MVPRSRSCWALAAVTISACSLARAYEHGNVEGLPVTCKQRLEDLYQQYYYSTEVSPGTFNCTEVIQDTLANVDGTNCTAPDKLRGCFNVRSTVASSLAYDSLQPACTTPLTCVWVCCSLLTRHGWALWGSVSCSLCRLPARLAAGLAQSLCLPTHGGCGRCTYHPLSPCMEVMRFIRSCQSSTLSIKQALMLILMGAARLLVEACHIRLRHRGCAESG